MLQNVYISQTKTSTTMSEALGVLLCRHLCSVFEGIARLAHVMTQYHGRHVAMAPSSHSVVQQLSKFYSLPPGINTVGPFALIAASAFFVEILSSVVSALHYVLANSAAEKPSQHTCLPLSVGLFGFFLSFLFFFFFSCTLWFVKMCFDSGSL